MAETEKAEYPFDPFEEFDVACKILRRNLRGIGHQTKTLLSHAVFTSPPEQSDCGEMKANLMLAYRHLEDAAYRLGKAIEANHATQVVYED